MNKSSSINWAAFFLGGFLWPLINRFYGWALAYSISALFITTIVFGVVGSDITFLVVSFAVAPIVAWIFAVYFVFRGNRMLSDRIEKTTLTFEEKQEAVEWIRKSQGRQVVGGIAYVIYVYVWQVYFALYVVQEHALFRLIEIGAGIHLVLLVVVLILDLRHRLYSEKSKYDNESHCTVPPSQKPLISEVILLNLRTRARSPWFVPIFVMLLVLLSIAFPLILHWL